MAKRERAAPVVHDDGFTINGCAFHVAAKYAPLDAIGQGSYGVVCSVRNAESDEKLAIKKITPMAGDEWDATHTLREIRLMRCLGAHENIISLKDLSMCQEKDELYMMMELADTDLHRLIQSSCPLTEGHIRVIMFQLLSGVKAMHDNGVLHRDLKPGNLLLNKDCELKVTDFGLARMMPKEHQSNDDENSDTPASASVVSPMTEYVVTRWYRPPELMLAPNGCYDGAVDMWSVGCILGELIARKPMFPGTDFMDQLTRVFKVIPIPDKDARGYFIEKDALKFLSSLPPAPPNALEKVAKSAGPLACDLIQKLLCFNPQERLSADAALAHPFFDGVKEEWGEIAPLKLDHSLEFAFENQSLPLATLRQYICSEVLAFREKELEAQRKKQSPVDDDGVPQQLLDDDEVLGKKIAVVKEPSGSGRSSHGNNHPLKLENDCAPGEGFTIKGCEFNVPPQYKALQVLGEGSYGIVCAASDAITKKNVAIKKITPMAGDEWDAKHTLREIRLMRYFGHHPNIASLQNLSTCTEKDELYIMMDLVDTDLHRLIQSKTTLEEAHIAAIMYQLLCGAKTLHENGVLHRDLKPGNILVSKNCDVKITDFGLSRYIPQASGRSSHHGEPGSAPPSSSSASLDKGKELMTEYVVTRWYRPPEIMLAPNGSYNESVDMWSIGCIFGELLNRRPLFPGTDFIDQLTKVFSVLPVPATSEKRGYSVEGDALKFLESLPPCSPSAMTKTFRKASPEAVSLLRRLLCINPERRITAKQALAHPYFKSIRQQLGEPPEFQVAKAFDFDFDNHECPLSHLKQLIQDEVKLLQKDRQDPATASSAPIMSTNPAAASHSSGGDDCQKEQREDTEMRHTTQSNNDTTAKEPTMASKKSVEASPTTTQPGSDSLSDDEDDFERAMLRDSHESSLKATGPPIAPKEFLAAKQSISPSQSHSSASCTSDKQHQQQLSSGASSKQQQHKDRNPETDGANSDSDSPQQSQQQQQQVQHRSKQQEQQPSVDSDDEQQEIIQVERTRRPVASSKLERPKSATGAHRATSRDSRDSRDEDHHHRQSSSRLSNNSHSSATSHNESSSFSSSAERWGQPRATTASRIHHPVYGATMSTNNDKRAKPVAGTTTTSRTATARSSSSSNQHSARDSSEKSDASRRPERVTISTSSSRSHSSSKTTPTSSKTTPTTSKTTPTSSSSSKEPLPEGWVKKTHSKSGREYYYDTLHKVSSWKHPSKMLENIFGTARVPSTSSSSSGSNQHSKSSLTPTSADSITPTSSKIVTSGRRTSLSGSSASAAALPKDWARRTDPKSGRLFYVNLLTNKSFAKLPSSVTAAMTKDSASSASATNLTTTSGSSASAAAAKKSDSLLRKKATIPQSPQFSQMSWQRKRVPSTDE